MLTYKTCLALKNAGFPQTKGEYPMDDFEWDGKTLCPSSEQLVEALGGRAVVAEMWVGMGKLGYKPLTESERKELLAKILLSIEQEKRNDLENKS